MAAGSSYPIDLADNNGVVHSSGTVNFTDSTNQPAPGGSSNIATAKAFSAVGLTGAVTPARFVGGTADLAPTTGTFAVNDFVTTTTGRVWVCTVAGTPGTWIEPASVTFAPKASPTFTGTVTVPAAAAVGSATKLADLTSYLTLTSGALPNTGAWVSATAKQNPVARLVTVNVECVFDGTNNAASVAIAISPDNVTFTTVGTPAVAAAINNLGASTMLVPVSLPNAWWIKLTFGAHASVAASSYY